MEGDLSLSQSFGGLRIANPDDIRPSSSPEQIKTPAAPPRPSSVDSSRAGNEPEPQSTSEAFPQLLGDSCEDTNGSLSFDPSSYNSTSDPSASNIPPVAAAQERVPYADLPRQAPNSDAQPQGSYPLQRRAHSGSNASTRPSSTIFNQMLSHPAPGAPREGTYRLRSESSRSSMSGVPSRSDSRSAHTALQAGVPTREASHRDRAYRQQGSGPNGGLPPRRSSRGMAQANGAYPSGSTPPTAPTYMAEDAPLPSSEEWKEKGASVVKREEIDEQGRPVTRYMKKGVKDFNFGRTLGEGSYSTVLAATDRQTLREYAIKVLDKRHIIKEKKVKYVNIEKDTLNRLTEHPGIVRLYYTFQDERSLYFVLDLASNGELLGVLKRMGTFDEECTRFYGAQILDAIEYMHSKGVIHRDLKPENVLLNDQMHVKITDFGTAKILNVPRMPEGGVGGYPSAGDPLDGVDSGKANSFVGTAEYVSPELLTDKSACKASDLWAFGCIVYQLLAGRPPFKAANEYQTFQKIVALDYEFPRGFPEVAKDLVERLLILDPAKRLSMEHIKNHEFFDGITWGRGLWKQKAPRLRSYVPPPQETIKLNGNGMSSVPPPISRAPSSALPGTASRPQPRIITELPPPSQLDIEWSPVLTRSNERILKLGNMIVLSQPTPHSPNSKNGSADSVETPKKFSRFFGGGGSKKRQRLVMITSSARIILAAAGGDEKKTKTEISLLAPGTTWKSSTDGKGLTTWSVETKDKMFIFEDPKPSGDATGKGSTIEWLDTIDRAKELAFAQSMNDPYSSDDTFKNTALPDSQNADDPPLRFDASGNNSRNTLTKNNQGFPDQDPAKVATGRKRFSRRQSRSGLAAVF